MVSSLQKRLNDSQLSVDSSRGSDSGMVPRDSPVGLGMQGQSDNDPLGTGKRVPGPGSVQSDMTDEGSASRTSGRPAAGWKGRMSSMLLRGPLNSPKSDTIKAHKVYHSYFRVQASTLHVDVQVLSAQFAGFGSCSTEKKYARLLLHSLHAFSCSGAALACLTVTHSRSC